MLKRRLRHAAATITPRFSALRALTGLAEHLPPDDRRATLHQALHTATTITDAIARTVLGERKMWTKKEEIWARRLGAKRALSSRSAVASIKTIPTTTTANGHKTCPHTHQRQGMSH